MLALGTRIRMTFSGECGTVVSADLVLCLSCSGNGAHASGYGDRMECLSCRGNGTVSADSILRDPLKAGRGRLATVCLDGQRTAQVFYESVMRELSVPELLAEIPV